MDMTALALPTHNLSARYGWVVNATTRQVCHRESETVTTAQDAEWAWVPFWTRTKNTAAAGVRSKDR